MWQARAGLHRRAAAMVSCHLRNADLAIPRNAIGRHARACPGHPRLFLRCNQDVDGRDKPGHDELDEDPFPWRPINCCFSPATALAPK
jgi:hypothetical protein